MVYLKVNEANQIVTGTAEDHQITTMDCMFTVAWVEDGEIKMWGCSDANGLIDSTQFYHSDAGFGPSEDMDEAQLLAGESAAINFLKTAKSRKVYKNDIVQ